MNTLDNFELREQINKLTDKLTIAFLELLSELKILEILDSIQATGGMPFWLLGRQHQVGQSGKTRL